MAATIQELRAKAQIIAQEQQIGGNTAPRIGGTFDTTADILEAALGDIDSNRQDIVALIAAVNDRYTKAETDQRIADSLQSVVSYLGTFQQSATGEDMAAQAAYAGDEVKKLLWYRVADGKVGVIENYPSSLYCTQILHLNTRTYVRILNFADATRQAVTAVGEWVEMKLPSREEWQAVLDDIATNARNIAGNAQDIANETLRATGEENALDARLSMAEADINTINGKIPAQASSSNQLTDKAYVDNAVRDVPQIKREVESHEERITELEDTAVRTGSYDASVSVGLADNLRGDTIVDAEFYKRKTGGTQSVGSGIAAIKEVRGKSIVWNQIAANNDFTNSENVAAWRSNRLTKSFNDNSMELSYDGDVSSGSAMRVSLNPVVGHKYLALYMIKASTPTICGAGYGGDYKTVVWQVGTSWNVYGYILTAKSTDRYVYAYAQLGGGNKVNIRYVNMFDLTLMFGAGNEPDTVEEFEKMFPLDYYDYNEGEVVPFAGQNLVTTGKNQYNPATGKANLLGGQTYQLLGTYTGATIDGVAVTLDSNNCFITTKDCVLEITGGNDTDTIVALYNGETNTYEPYEKHTLPLDPSQWRDKQGNLVFPYGGMHGVGTAYDYAKVDADGYIRKAMRVYERRAYESEDVTSGNIITDGRTYTFYPLATPVEVELATPVYAKYLVDKDGTEEITPANGTTPYTTMANLSILYAMDARGEIKNLPKNYLSKESAENMLNAMVTAGVIESYTMAYDSANARYQFTFVKAEEAQTNQVSNESNI